MKKVSVIITVYNNSNYLEKCIGSILEQSYLPKEVILVDDGSRDNLTKNIFKKNKLQKINFRYYKIKNKGPGGARNFALKKIKSDYFIFFDPDDIMKKDFIKDKLKIFNLKKNKNLIGVYSNLKFIYKNSIKIIKYKKNISSSKDIDSIGYENGISGSLPSYLLKKHSIFNRVKFDEKIKINEDFDYIIRLLKNKKELYGIDKVHTIVNIHKNSLTRLKKNQLLIYRNQKKFLLKAHKKNYFSTDELKKRNKYTEKLMVKNSIKNFDVLNFFRYLIKYLDI